VIKNTKLSEKKFITLATNEPISGQSLNHAMVIEDKQTRVWYEPEGQNNLKSDELSIEEIGKQQDKEITSDDRAKSKL
jgi:hypothetical protein